jgi:MarR family transcriptional regulator, lower aerobic nicotinate degradation pathway regulator
MALLRIRKNPRGQTGVAGHDVARALRAAYLALHRQTNASLADDGVTADQFVVLSALADADAVTQQDLVRRVSSDPNTVRAILLLLEGRGLVAREPHPGDGRARRVTLTPKGRGLFRALWAKTEPVRARLLAAFGADEMTTLLALLRRVAGALAPPAGDG